MQMWEIMGFHSLEEFDQHQEFLRKRCGDGGRVRELVKRSIERANLFAENAVIIVDLRELDGPEEY